MKHKLLNTKQTIEYITSREIEFKSFMHEQDLEKMIFQMINEEYSTSSVIKKNTVKGGSLELINELFVNENSNFRFCVDLNLLSEDKYPIVNDGYLKGDYLITLRDIANGIASSKSSKYFCKNYTEEFQDALIDKMSNIINKICYYQIHFVEE
ncbi:hypothetical protein PVK64_14760 [Aliivibrio sp. S4TY2]|uniref:Uncharacterized protein n=1 Tax=Aliivibrio finisterrensis TaxID=511998 RepID=A0A4Q5KTD2_9GAMM|nr:MULTISPECIES: hypothetical protein [Aliivibrio]MDD9157431.1 hypothetical protein [Aliivibrio sp. S4TY2]MDD9157432.1 hypothetical protein [Aliivibrio sp. S4TY2]MDD9161375.1 hypothetical protein [Aliivibrio sp. S4TY1]MDD9165405.1 hypothetical protein [Aliivibrio sp. S4MY2]MDD9169340.1 hypothetical protein [Aliivibrio sp. S4MY4]